jgi:hypothetical protein
LIMYTVFLAIMGEEHWLKLERCMAVGLKCLDKN